MTEEGDAVAEPEAPAKQLEQVPQAHRDRVGRQLRALGVQGDGYPRQHSKERQPQPWDQPWPPQKND